MQLFDFCVVTASSARQADDFRRLIQKRLDAELYPREICFRVYADPPGGRVGSGGGTLWALRSLLEEEGTGDPALFFESRRILVIHAGGESRRLPCFAPEGKLFSPLPVESSALLPPVAFDLQLPLFLKFPWRRGEVLVASGDVVLDFDAAAVDGDRGDICGFAKPAPPEQGARHGVFKFDPRLMQVEDFLQKAPVEHLRERALLEGTGDCALDVGLVALSPAASAALLSFGAALRFDLYSEVLTAALPGLSFEAYQQRIGRSSLPPVAARRLFDILSPFTLRAVLIRSSSFVHLGTLREFPSACRELVQRGLQPFYEQDPGELRPFTSAERIVFNSHDVQVAVRPSSFVLVEGCRAVRIREAQGDNLFVGLEDFTLDAAVPPGFCLEQRRGRGETVLLVYGNDDTFTRETDPASVVVCGQPLPTWLAQRRLTMSDVHSASPVDPLDLPLYCAGVPPEFAAGYWSVPDASWSEQFRAARRVSLKQLNAEDDVVPRDERRTAIRSRLLAQAILGQQGWRTVSALDFRRAFTDPRHRPALQALFERTDDSLLRLYRHALLAELEPADDAPPAPVPRIDFVDRPEGAPLRLHLKLDQIVWARCPVRLDLAGGWTDTPPYTLRYGGQVVNVAVDLNGQPPIQVFCRRTEEPHVRIHSVDLGLTETIGDFRALADYGDPGAAFALPKAALAVLGLGPDLGAATLSQALSAMGGGLEMTLLCAVPKGSGLGTSSILGATMVAALHRFFGRPTLHAELSRQVLQIEQMLTTGGGWQDQLGGIVGGAKYIESRPGSRPNPLVYQLDPALFQDRATAPCFTLFYTGLTRLAKNILVDVVRRVNGSSRAYLFTLRYMRQLAVAARDAIALRRLDDVASIVSESWEANKRIHASTTNEEVETLLARTAPYYSGVKLLGAGGGGYALFVSPNVPAAEKLRSLLQKEFENDRARLVEVALNPAGLAVSVS